MLEDDLPLEQYFNEMDEAYDSLQEGERPIPDTKCSPEMMRLMIKSNKTYRDHGVKVYVRSATSRFVQTDIDNFLAHLTQLAKKSKTPIRAQLIVCNPPHYNMIDFKCSKYKKECILLDAAGDNRAGLLTICLTKFMDCIYIAEDLDDCILGRNQIDNFSCPMFSLFQSEELSKIDIYDYLDTLDVEESYGMKHLKWEDLPPQLSMNAQCSERRLAQLTRHYKQLTEQALESGYMPYREFRELTSENLADCHGVMVNGGIRMYFDRVRAQTLEYYQNLEPTMIAGKTAEKSLPSVSKTKSTVIRSGYNNPTSRRKKKRSKFNFSIRKKKSKLKSKNHEETNITEIQPKKRRKNT